MESGSPSPSYSIAVHDDDGRASGAPPPPPPPQPAATSARAAMSNAANSTPFLLNFKLFLLLAWERPAPRLEPGSHRCVGGKCKHAAGSVMLGNKTRR